jgi:hypothetical protein
LDSAGEATSLALLSDSDWTGEIWDLLEVADFCFGTGREPEESSEFGPSLADPLELFRAGFALVTAWPESGSLSSEKSVDSTAARSARLEPADFFPGPGDDFSSSKGRDVVEVGDF